MGRSIYASLVLLLFVAVSRQASPPQEYWRAVLPNTSMPGAVRNLFRPDALDENATVNVEAGKGMLGGTSVDVGNKGVGVNAPGNTHVSFGGGGGGGGVHVGTGKEKPAGTNVDVGHGGVGVNVGGFPGKAPVIVTVPGYRTNGFAYGHAASEAEIHDNPDVTLFFLEKDLFPGAKMNLYFARTVTGAAFMSRSAANAIPFSSKKLPEILSRFTVKPNSLEAQAMKNTLQECEEPAPGGEARYCATSLESMVDFATSSLRTRDVWAVSTEVGKKATPKQHYTVAYSGVQKLAGSKAVSCHARPYAYAVFYCHLSRATKGYVVPLVGKDGTKVNAVAVCHTDTSSWNPRHLAFLLLKVKPGTVPVCHFLPQDHIVWAPRY